MEKMFVRMRHIHEMYRWLASSIAGGMDQVKEREFLTLGSKTDTHIHAHTYTHRETEN